MTAWPPGPLPKTICSHYHPPTPRQVGPSLPRGPDMHSWSARLPGAPRLSTRGLGPALPSCPGPRPAELICANTHVLISTQMHACTYKHTYAHMHTHTCTHAHMLTCMHTYILALWLQVGLAKERTSRILEWGAKGRKKLGSCLSSIPSCQGWFGGAGLLTPVTDPLPYPVPGQPAASPGNSSEMQILRPHHTH